MRRTVLGLAGCVVLGVGAGGARAGGGKPAVKVLTSFEWEEYAGKLPRFWYLGRPYLAAAPSGWKGVPIERPEDVGDTGFQIMDGDPSHSRHHANDLMVPQHATQGRFAWKTKLSPARWQWIKTQLGVKWPGAWPPHEPLYDVQDHFFQRECQLYGQTWKATADWSGYDRLRFDVTVTGAPVRLGVRVRDGSGPKLPPGPTGLRTALGLFTVPADETVTCDFPLAEMAAVGELDLAKVHRYTIRLNGFPTDAVPADLYLDNIRLVAAGGESTPKHRLIGMEGGIRPFARPVVVRPPTGRYAEGLKRESGPVEPLGPVVINPTALYAGRLGHGGGHFGKSGATYFTNSRRAVIAYDNRRLLVVIGGQTRARGGEGGTIAVASFDGGATWGGLTPEDKAVTVLPWYLRSGFFGDQYGNVFAVGTPNCDSYNEGQDICVHRLCFTGRTWVDDRFAVIHQDGYKCPSFCEAITLPSGRIWAAWNDGFGGTLARYSDDDGFTWVPCKDASLKAPRPFYTPRLADYRTADPPEPPKEVLLWPTPAAAGSFVVPYKGQVAVFSGRATEWAAHDGTTWGLTQKGPNVGGTMTVSVLDEEHVFISRGGQYNDLGKELLADLVVADLKPDGTWTKEVLEPADIASAIVTASGDAMYCFYVKKVADDAYEVRYRRWTAGTWEPSVRVATDDRRINHLAAPQVGPPDYAAIFWDQHFRTDDDTSEVKFVRVPNR